MNTKQLEILQITQAMFNAAPGAQFLSEFSAFIDNGNASTKQLANALAETTVFKQSMYSETLNNTEFATQFVDNIVEDLVVRLKEQVGDDEVMLGLSGGVDSSVLAALLQFRHIRRGEARKPRNAACRPHERVVDIVLVGPQIRVKVEIVSGRSKILKPTKRQRVDWRDRRHRLVHAAFP